MPVCIRRQTMESDEVIYKNQSSGKSEYTTSQTDNENVQMQQPVGDANLQVDTFGDGENRINIKVGTKEGKCQTKENNDMANSINLHLTRTKTCQKRITNSSGYFRSHGINSKYLDNLGDMGLQASDLRMVVIGKAGNGKSDTANTIVGEEKFLTDMCASSVTHVCQREDAQVNGRRISVVDTPGLFDISTSNDEIAKEIANFISLTIPGPHAVLFIGKIGRFTQEDRNTFDKVVEYFGESILEYCIVVFTHHDVWKRKNKNKTITDFVKSSKEWSRITQRCSNRYVAFDNDLDDPTNKQQVEELITMVTDMTQNNNDSFYSNQLYVQATNRHLAKIDRENKIREEEVRLKELERKLIEEKHRLIAEEQKRQEEERKRQEEERKRQEEERKRLEEERKRQERDKIRQKEEQKRQRDELIARKLEIERQNEKEMKRLATEEARLKKQQYEIEEKSKLAEEHANRLRERREEELRQEERLWREERLRRVEELQRREEERYRCSVS